MEDSDDVEIPVIPFHRVRDGDRSKLYDPGFVVAMRTNGQILDT